MEQAELKSESSADKSESKIMKVSVRAWLAVILVVTVCVMSVWGKNVIEPLYSMALLAMGFYFGQAKEKK